MRRVHAICTFTEYQYAPEVGSTDTYLIIKDITVITANHHTITLYNKNWDSVDSEHAYKYKYVSQMMQTVLNFLKHNNMYAKCYSTKYYTFYDITCIDTNTCTHHCFHMPTKEVK